MGARGRAGRGPPLPGPALGAPSGGPSSSTGPSTRLPQLRLHDHPPRPRRAGGRAGRQGRRHRSAGHRGHRPRCSTATAGRRRRGRRCPSARAPRCRRTRRRAAPRCGPATWWWRTGPTRASAGPSAPSRDRQLPLGMALRGYYRSAAQRRALHRVAPRHPRRRRRRRARLRLDLPPRRRPGERGRRAPLDRAALEGDSTPPGSWTRSSAGRPDSWGLSPETSLRPADRGEAAHGPGGRAAHRPQHPGGRRRRRPHQPVQRRGDRLRLRDRAPGRGVPGRGAVGRRGRRRWPPTSSRARATPTATTTGSAGPSCASSASPACMRWLRRDRHALRSRSWTSCCASWPT